MALLPSSSSANYALSCITSTASQQALHDDSDAYNDALAISLSNSSSSSSASSSSSNLGSQNKPFQYLGSQTSQAVVMDNINKLILHGHFVFIKELCMHLYKCFPVTDMNRAKLNRIRDKLNERFKELELLKRKWSAEGKSNYSVFLHPVFDMIETAQQRVAEYIPA
jgi:hypothetical protein